MSTMQETVAPEVAAPNSLRAVDRCDVGACGSQAYVRVETLAGDLLFCGHDYAKRKDALASVAINIQDERARLLPQPYDPATDNS